MEQVNGEKLSRAEYLREWRKRKKTDSHDGMIVNVIDEVVSGFFDSLRNSRVVPQIPAITACLSITVYLISLSSMYSVGSDLIVYGLPTLVEVILLILVSMETRTLVENLIRWILIVGMTVYSVAPIVMAPVKAEKEVLEAKLKAEQSEVDAKLDVAENKDALKNEIKTRTEIANVLNSQGRIDESLRELKKVAALHAKLAAVKNVSRQNETKMKQGETVANTSETVSETNDTVLKQDETIFHQEIKKLPAWVLILQRLLFMLCNLFLVHHVARSIKKNSSNLL